MGGNDEPVETSFLRGVLGALIPVVLAIGVALVGTVLYYLFWFGF